MSDALVRSDQVVSVSQQELADREAAAKAEAAEAAAQRKL